jgi:hypothetical protein
MDPITLALITASLAGISGFSDILKSYIQKRLKEKVDAHVVTSDLNKLGVNPEVAQSVIDEVLKRGSNISAH